MQPRCDDSSAAARSPAFQAMTLDIRGVLQGGFSSVLDIPQIQAAGAGSAANTNCKSANCGNCTICPKPK